MCKFILFTCLPVPTFLLPTLSDSIIPLRRFLITSQTSDVIGPALHFLGLLAWFETLAGFARTFLILFLVLLLQ